MTDLRFVFIGYLALAALLIVAAIGGVVWAILTYDDGMIRADAAGAGGIASVLIPVLLSRMGEVVRAMNRQTIPDTPATPLGD